MPKAYDMLSAKFIEKEVLMQKRTTVILQPEQVEFLEIASLYFGSQTRAIQIALDGLEDKLKKTDPGFLSLSNSRKKGKRMIEKHLKNRSK